MNTTDKKCCEKCFHPSLGYQTYCSNVNCPCHSSSLNSASGWENEMRDLLDLTDDTDVIIDCFKTVEQAAREDERREFELKISTAIDLIEEGHTDVETRDYLKSLLTNKDK